jgi:uncharacterized protein YcaQ
MRRTGPWRRNLEKVTVHELSRLDARRIAVRAQLLEFMVARGEVAIAGRRGADRRWDLAARVYPDDPVVPRKRH